MVKRQVVTIPMEVQMSIKNSTEELKRISSEMQKQFNGIDLTTPFGKQFSKIVNQLNKGFAAIDASALGTELFDETDFKKIVGQIEKINTAIQTLKIHGLGGTARQMGVDITALEEAEEAYKRLKKAKEDYAKTSVGELAPDKLNDFEKEKHRTGFNANATYKQNLVKLSSKKGITKSQLAELETEASKQEREAAKQRAEAAAEAAKAAENYYNNVVESYENLKKGLPTDKAAKEAAQAELEHQGKLKAQADIARKFTDVALPRRGIHKEDTIAGYNQIFEKELKANVTPGGNFTKDGETFVQVVAKMLDYSDKDISQLLRRKATGVIQELQSKLQEAAEKNLFSVLRKATPVKNSYTEGDYEATQKAAQEAEERYNKNQTQLLQLEQDKKQGKADSEAAEAKKKAAEKQFQELSSIYNDTKKLVEVLDKHIDELRELSKAFDKDIDDKYDNDIKQAEQNIKEASNAALEDVQKALKEYSEKSTPLTKDVGSKYRGFSAEQDALHAESEAAEKAAKAAARESQEFTDNLKQSIRHWMSAQQVINMVKDGIRQAYHDIKGLDTAMTNIAVVTDMSVSDLWGKINDYMSIAQQYGVTTQGVYEVSQLYYQQGLSTNEVMAATTETLKMARIAGMDYAEAADAMTVAIRAFKMEITDAEHVTDVYSKVAAVTASDSEELAIAMSKTASSAESVGSSFENTTAMLAVMINVTIQ